MKKNRSWVGILLIFVSFVHDIGVKYNTFGFNWTLYRTTVMLLFVGYLFSHRGIIRLYRRNYFSEWLLFLLFWIADGVLLMLFSRYSDYHRGFLELLSLINGLMVILVMLSIYKDSFTLHRMFKTVLVLLNAFILIGYVEILTGVHLPTSMFRDPNSEAMRYHLYAYDARLAAGNCYNINDFSCMLTAMLPVTLLFSKKYRWLAAFDVVSVIIINIINDANICTFAILTGITLGLLLATRGRSRKVLLGLSFGIVITVVCAVVALQVYQKVGDSNIPFIGQISMQILNFTKSTGSMYYRLVLYRDAIMALLKSGLIGWGPGSFMNYFQLNPSSSGVVNPHCYLIEIAFQYGLLVVCAFLVLVASCIRRALKMYKRGSTKGNVKYLMVFEFLVIYLMVSFAPSSYIGYQYQWAILGVCCCILQKKDEGELA